MHVFAQTASALFAQIGSYFAADSCGTGSSSFYGTESLFLFSASTAASVAGTGSLDMADSAFTGTGSFTTSLLGSYCSIAMAPLDCDSFTYTGIYYSF